MSDLTLIIRKILENLLQKCYNLSMDTYFNERDAENIQKLNNIIENDLPAFCEDYFVGISARTTPLTRLNYAYDLRTFFDYVSARIFKKPATEITLENIESLSPIHIESYLNYLELYKDENGAIVRNSDHGKSRKLAAIRSLVRYFERKELLRYNPTASVDTPKLHTKEIIRLSHNEIGTMIDTVDSGNGLSSRQQKYQENTKLRDLAMISLFLGTGIRVSELVGIDVDDVNFADNSFVVTRKGGSRVILYFNDEVKGYLYDYYKIRTADKSLADEPALFLSLQKRRITTRAVENIVKKYAQIATPLKHITPHKLRSTFGTELYRSTGDIYAVAHVLGHKDVNTTRKHYAAISDDVRKKAAETVKLIDDYNDEND